LRVLISLDPPQNSGYAELRILSNDLRCALFETSVYSSRMIPHPLYRDSGQHHVMFWHVHGAMLKRSPDTSDQDRPYAQPLPPFSWRSLHHVQEAHPLRLLMRRSTSSILLQALVIGRHTYCLNQKEASISSSPLSFPAVVVLAVTRRGAIITWLESRDYEGYC
jgi:hypothetical protein